MLTEQQLEDLVQWVLATRPLFADRILFERSPEMMEVRQRLLREADAMLAHARRGE